MSLETKQVRGGDVTKMTREDVKRNFLDRIKSGEAEFVIKKISISESHPIISSYKRLFDK